MLKWLYACAYVVIYWCLSGYILVLMWLYTCSYVVIYLCLSGYILVLMWLYTCVLGGYILVFK